MTELDQVTERLAAQGFVVTLTGLVAEPAAAAVLGVARGTLRNWRCAGNGPPFVKIRGRVWYPLALLVEWIDETSVHELSFDVTGRHETSPISRRPSCSMKP